MSLSSKDVKYDDEYDENRNSEGLSCPDEAPDYLAHRGYHGGWIFLRGKARAVALGDDFASGPYIDWDGIVGFGDGYAK